MDADLFDSKDAGRLNGTGFTKDSYINEGPGRYIAEVVGFKLKKSQKDKTYGREIFIFELEIIKAEVLPRGNEKYEPEFKVGDRVTYMKVMDRRVNRKEGWTMLGACLGLPPATVVPSGPDAGATLPLLSDEIKLECADNEAEGFIGHRCAIDVVPNEGSGDYAGKTFYNAYPKPVDDSGESAAQFPDLAGVIEAGIVDVPALYKARFGKEFKPEYASV